MKHSLRYRITIILSLSIILLILLCIISNELFLEKYYVKEKLNYLNDSYQAINQVAGIDYTDDDETVISSIEKIEASYNVNAYIIAENYNSSGQSTGLVYVYPIEMEIGSDSYGNLIKHEQYKRISLALRDYIFGSYLNISSNSFQILDTVANHFDVYKYYDAEVASNYLDLVGYLDNGHLIFIRSNYENIEESTAISVRFLSLVGLFVVMLGSIAMYVFSRTFTKPILALSRISDNMAALNFEEKYQGKRQDEIGQLGESINTLSNKLESTITELKTANIELEKDLQNKLKIDEMRKEFLSNVSHELKTPIALIQGYAEGLQDNINDDAESREFYCEVIIDEARKMNNIVKKLLSLNEIEFGRDHLDLSRFDIVQLVNSVTSSIDILLKQNQVQLVNKTSEPIYVWADQNLIEEVVTNYLSNALNHISGNRIIDINYTCHDKRVRVSIFNTGEPIPEEDLDKIWDKFYKVDKARTREYGGSGIGLSIVKAIMDQHNQAYGVCNHSSGVEFWFELDINTYE